MKIFLYNEHAIKNTPARPRADTVTKSMRGWHRLMATTKLEPWPLPLALPGPPQVGWA